MGQSKGEVGVTEEEKDRTGEINMQRRVRQNKVESYSVYIYTYIYIYIYMHTYIWYKGEKRNAWKRRVQVGHNVDGTVKKEKGEKR